MPKMLFGESVREGIITARYWIAGLLGTLLILAIGLFSLWLLLNPFFNAIDRLGKMDQVDFAYFVQLAIFTLVSGLMIGIGYGIIIGIPLFIELLKGRRMEIKFDLPKHTYWQMEYEAEQRGLTLEEFNNLLAQGIRCTICDDTGQIKRLSPIEQLNPRFWGYYIFKTYPREGFPCSCDKGEHYRYDKR